MAETVRSLASVRRASEPTPERRNIRPARATQSARAAKHAHLDGDRPAVAQERFAPLWRIVMSAPFNLAETDRLLSTTRAVRKRLDLTRPVERNVILDCIRLSQQAPTGSNSQSWRWVVVSDAAKRAELARLYREIGDQYLEIARSSIPAGEAQTQRVYDSAFWLKDHLHEVPVHVIPCVIGRLPESAPFGMTASVFGSIFPAVWSFQLALRSRGLGSALT